MKHNKTTCILGGDPWTNDDPEWWEKEKCFKDKWDGFGLDTNDCEEKILSQCSKNEHLKCAFNTNNRVIACGDIHGDYELLKTILKLNDLAKFDNGEWKWIDNDATLVLCGDLVDMYRNHHQCYFDHSSSYKPKPGPVEEVDYAEWKIFMLLSELRTQGADIIRLYGNHELMLKRGDEKYRTTRSLQNDLKRHHKWAELWSQGVYSRLMSECGGGRAIIRINNWIFCHGGINPKYIKAFKQVVDMHGNTPNDSNGKYGDYILETYNQFVYDYMTNKQTHSGTQTENFAHNLNGILWDRTFGSNNQIADDSSQCAELRDLLQQLYPESWGNMRMCIAHCVQNQDGLFPDTTRTNMYSMTNIVEHTDSRLKISLPATRCNYTIPFNKRHEGDSVISPGYKCFPIPCINFTCIPPDTKRRHSDSNMSCSSSEVNMLGNVWRIDCGMSRGLQLRRDILQSSFAKFLSSKSIDDFEKQRFLDYFYRAYDMAVAPQNIEILPKQDGQYEETVNHVIHSSVRDPFEEFNWLEESTTQETDFMDTT